MITMNELVDFRMQQHIAHEIYRQQIMQRIPDPFQMLTVPMPHHMMMPPQPTLPGVDAKLGNDDLWKQFHEIGTEMIITKSGRRMFPSMRVSLSGLEDQSNYCVLLEMVSIGDCRFKFSGSQWVPAGGAEPQSPQRMFLHPDSPASGAHWKSQPILFNKVKLTNNTLDNNGHIVLASMHKYQPRIHIIRTSDPAQIPWAPQKSIVFPETEFVAVTAYQNDRITKLKIDHNPFAKGFRETSFRENRKRKIIAIGEDQSSDTPSSIKSISPLTTTSDTISDCGKQSNDDNSQHHKRTRSNSPSSFSITSIEDERSSINCGSSSGTTSPDIVDPYNQRIPLLCRQQNSSLLMQQFHHNIMHNVNADLAWPTIERQTNEFYMNHHQLQHQQTNQHQIQNQHQNSPQSHSHFRPLSIALPLPLPLPLSIPLAHQSMLPSDYHLASENVQLSHDISQVPKRLAVRDDLLKTPKISNFSISSILGVVAKC